MKNHPKANVKPTNREAIKAIHEALGGLECEICGDIIGAVAIGLEARDILRVTIHCPKCHEIFVLGTEGKPCRSC